jgi:hypothetical protein
VWVNLSEVKARQRFVKQLDESDKVRLLYPESEFKDA